MTSSIFEPGPLWSKAGQFIPDPASPELAASVLTFRTNIERLHSLGAMWNHLLVSVIVRENAAAHATYAHEHWPSSYPRPPLEIFVHTRVAEAVTEAEAELKKSQSQGQMTPLMKILYERSVQAMGTVASLLTIQEGLEAWYAAHITGAWTAFEVLAKDVWVDAVAPNLSLGMAAFKIGKLANLEGLVEGYTSAFSANAPRVPTLIGSRHIAAVHAVRNLIVHSRSKCDSQYQKEAFGNPSLKPLAIGDPLPITAPFVEHLLRPFVETIVDLVREIDAVLGPNQP